MKILFGMPSKDSWGGPIACEPPLVEALQTMVTEVSTEDYVYGDKIKPTPTLSRIIRVLKTALRFRRVIRNNDFDLIHLNTAFDRRSVMRDAASIFLMRPGRAKIFLKVHGASANEFSGKAYFFRALVRYLASRVDGYGINTSEEMNALAGIGLDRSKFHLVQNVITINESKPEGFVREQRSPTEVFQILFASRFIAAKGVLETIKACAMLRDRGARFVLHCVGDGPVKAEAALMAAELRLEDSIKFTGHITEGELTKLFFDCDIFVFPTSHNEGFPIVLFNAVAVGLPIVTTKIRAAADYLSEPENCLFCERDPASVADRLTELVESQELREHMSRRNLELGSSFSAEQIAKKHLDIYNEVVGV